MRKKKHSFFKSKAHEKAWRHQTMMTVGKLVTWLQTLDQDGLVYFMERNTGDFQEIPDDFPSMYFQTVKEAKKADRKNLANAYKSSYSDKAALKKKVQQEIKSIYKYTESNGIVVN